VSPRRRTDAEPGAQRLHRTVDIPQADRLENIRQFAAAIRDEIYHPAALLELLGVDERHFAYYRRAAVILGIISETPDGLTLSERGKSLLATPERSEAERNCFREAIRSARALKPFHSLFEGEAVPFKQVADRLQVLTGLAPSTAERRTQTLFKWREYISGGTRRGSGPQVPELTTQLESLIARHNALAKQGFLEWMQKMDPSAFEQLVGKLVHAMNHSNVVVQGGPGDGGIDVRAVKIDQWNHPTSVAIQVKRHGPNNPVGRKYVDELIGVMTRERLASGILVTTADFTAQARQAAEQEPRLQLINGAQLVDLLARNGVGVKYGKYGEIVIASATEAAPSN
jgi:restriction endonuclease Mrr